MVIASDGLGTTKQQPLDDAGELKNVTLVGQVLSGVDLVMTTALPGVEDTHVVDGKALDVSGHNK